MHACLQVHEYDPNKEPSPDGARKSRKSSRWMRPTYHQHNQGVTVECVSVYSDLDGDGHQGSSIEENHASRQAGQSSSVPAGLPLKRSKRRRTSQGYGPYSTYSAYEWDLGELEDYGEENDEERLLRRL
jgi:hypothetical protein